MFGRAYALCQTMMQTLIETHEQALGPLCTREEARELLESLRAAYQKLPLPERILVKTAVSQLARAQSAQEME